MILIEPLEATIVLNTNDIVEAREWFVERMTWMFNMAVCDGLQGQRTKCNPVDDAIDEDTKKYIKEMLTNKMCESDSDHEWECCGISTAGTTYICKKCHSYKTYPAKCPEISVNL